MNISDTSSSSPLGWVGRQGEEDGVKLMNSFYPSVFCMCLCLSWTELDLGWALASALICSLASMSSSLRLIPWVGGRRCWGTSWWWWRGWWCKTLGRRWWSRLWLRLRLPCPFLFGQLLLLLVVVSSAFHGISNCSCCFMPLFIFSNSWSASVTFIPSLHYSTANWALWHSKTWQSSSSIANGRIPPLKTLVAFTDPFIN